MPSLDPQAWLEYLRNAVKDLEKFLNEPGNYQAENPKRVGGTKTPTGKIKSPFKSDKLPGKIIEAANHKELLCAEMLAERLTKYHGYKNVDVSMEELTAYCETQLKMWEEDSKIRPPDVVMGFRYAGYNPNSRANAGKKVPLYMGKLGIKLVAPKARIAHSGLVKVLRNNPNKSFTEEELIKQAYRFVGRSIQLRHTFHDFIEIAKEELDFYTGNNAKYKGYIGKTASGMYHFIDRKKKNK